MRKQVQHDDHVVRDKTLTSFFSLWSRWVHAETRQSAWTWKHTCGIIASRIEQTVSACVTAAWWTRLFTWLRQNSKAGSRYRANKAVRIGRYSTASRDCTQLSTTWMQRALFAHHSKSSSFHRLHGCLYLKVQNWGEPHRLPANVFSVDKNNPSTRHCGWWAVVHMIYLKQEPHTMCQGDSLITGQCQDFIVIHNLL